MLLLMNSYGQSTELKCLTATKYDSLLIGLVEGKKGIIEAQTYKKQADDLKATVEKKNVEIERKEKVIVTQLDLKWRAVNMADSLEKVVALKNELIESKDKQLKAAGKPKRFAFGIQAGYGYQLGPTITRGFNIGAGLQWNIFKF